MCSEPRTPNAEPQTQNLKPIRVLIVDDSSFMRASLAHILKTDSSIGHVETAANGEEALNKVKELRPDVVLLDMMLPGMPGLDVLEYIMVESPLPVLVISGIGKEEPSIIIKAFDYGAVDYIEKPSGQISYDIEKIADEIIYKVKVAARARVDKLIQQLVKGRIKLQTHKPQAQEKIVVIGASTGGPKAVAYVLSGLPQDIHAAVIVVQHMGAEFMPSFAERLKWGCAVDVSLAKKDEKILPGRVLIAPGGCHTAIVKVRNDKRIQLSKKTGHDSIAPSIDYAMESAARAYGRDAVAALLTGAGEDGARGMKAIKDAGGATIAEDESTCVVFGMPKAAIEAGAVDDVVPLHLIAERIVEKVMG